MNILPFIQSTSLNLLPDSNAVIDAAGEITYKKLSELVERTINFLSGQNINKNDLVALLYNNNAEFIVAVLSLWETGAVPVLLNIRLTEKELNEQIDFINPVLTIKDKKLNDIQLNSNTVNISFEDSTNYIREIKETNFSGDKTAVVIFTSGSSGKPKAVMLSFDNLIQSALIGNKFLNQTGDDRWLASLPFYHIGGFSIIVRALIFGAAIIIPESLSYYDIGDAIKKNKPTLASLVSNQLKYFVEDGFTPNKELRSVLLGGGFTDNNLVLNAIGSGWNIAKVYGSTETSSFVSFMNTEEIKKNPGASGKAIPPNDIIISAEGEIAVKSPAVMKGYFKNDEETSDRIKNGFYYTGDAGLIDSEGYLVVEAKRDDLIISGGENINPFEVEDVILTHPEIADACVVGVKDERWGQIISTAVILNSGSVLSEEDLKKYLKERLAGFKVPKKIIFVAHLPKSGIGKVQREKVRDFFKD